MTAPEAGGSAGRDGHEGRAASANAPAGSAAPEGARLVCWNCNASLDELPRPITRHMNCPACYEDLHCCRMCRHFRDRTTNACADERAEPPTHKEGANFCDYFRPAAGSYRTGANERQTQAKSRLNALFEGERTAEGGGQAAAEEDDAAPPAEDEARRKLDALFR